MNLSYEDHFEDKLRSELDALNKGRTALECNRLTDASAWLDRASRLAPTSAAIKLLHASCLAALDDPRTEARLDHIVSCHPVAWTAARLLADHACRIGKSGRASHLLWNLLSRSVIPTDKRFRRLATYVAEVSMLPGWTGLSHEGLLLASAPCVLRLDGLTVELRTTRNADGLLRAKLPKDWRHARTLDVEQAGCHLLGSPIDIGAHNLVQGVVELEIPENATSQMRVKGWAWMPGSPDTQPNLRILAANRRTVLRSLVADDEGFRATSSHGVARPRGFSVDVSGLHDESVIHVVDFLARDLYGSPLNVAGHLALSKRAGQNSPDMVVGAGLENMQSPQPALVHSAPVCRSRRQQVSISSCDAMSSFEPPAVDIIIPVFSGAKDFLDCLQSIRRSQISNYRVVVVDDASRDVALKSALLEEELGGTVILRQARNKGFPAAANVGIRHSMSSPGEPRDVVLLNPDTLVTSGWLNRLRTTAYLEDNMGSVTPMTNDGSIVSYPTPGRVTEIADQFETEVTACCFAEINSGCIIDLPTAVGFCMYIKHDCLIETGLFCENFFAQGYAEENDWSMRARQLGWRHVVDGAAFVSHTGGRSFGEPRHDLMARNLSILRQLHPGYDALVGNFLDADPLKTVRRNVDIARWRRQTARQGSAIMITHTLGGGVERHVRERSQAIRAQGLRPIVLRPPKEQIESDQYSELCHVSEEEAEAFPNMLFRWDTECAELLQLLRHEKPRWIEIHHFVGHEPKILKLPELLGVPFDLVLHDFALVCPRISMCGRSKVYCGEPTDVRDCESCVNDSGNRLADAIGPAALRERTTDLVAAARRVVAPTNDTARRFSRYVTASRLDILPWEDDFKLSGQVPRVRTRAKGESVRVCVVGAIGEEKGYDVLLACARDAARRALSLSFNVVGHTIDDTQLIDTDRAFVTGYYEEDECLELIKTQDADIGMLPSVWPEPWCYTLSALWRAALWPVVFDIGGHAERVRRTGIGTLLPIGMPADQINDALLALVGG